MKIVFLSHPFFLGHQSMPRYLRMLSDGMRKRGHDVEILAPVERFAKLSKTRWLKKWLGYIDQFIIFRHELKARVKTYPNNTLFVFTDHALGPWVPVVKERPHIIHCHDFIAQRSALGQMSGNDVGRTGRSYQRYIRNGYSTGRNFISVSKKTREDLHEFLGREPELSKVVYNGLNAQFSKEDEASARRIVQKAIGAPVNDGFLLHVGGNQWYKNRVGVVDVYTEWRRISDKRFPLLLVGEDPDNALQQAKLNSPYAADIFVVSGKDDAFIRSAYSGASLFLFPSLAEGFGWPIAEAMACGCIVVTTGERPMTEVGSDAAVYIPRMPVGLSEKDEWKKGAATVINEILNLSSEERLRIVNKGYENIKRFDVDHAVDEIELIYKTLIPSI